MTRVYRGLALSVLFLAACATEKQKPAQRESDPIIAAIKDEITKDSTNWELQAKLSDELRHRNRLAEADTAAQKAFMLAPSPGYEARLEMAKVHAAANRPAAAINLVKEIEKKRAAGEKVDEVKIAEVYAVLGDTVAVFRWLERAKAASSPYLQTLDKDDDFKWVKTDPRWIQLFGKQN